MSGNQFTFELAFEQRQQSINDIQKTILPRIDKLLAETRENDLARRRMLLDQRNDALRHLKQLQTYGVTRAELRCRARKSHSLHPREGTNIPSVAISQIRDKAS